MGLQIIKKIERRLNTSRRRTISFYSNLIAGIITGGCIGGLFPFFKKAYELGSVPKILALSILLIVALWVLYKIGKKSLYLTLGDNSEATNYNSNFIAGFIASFFVTLVIIVGLVYTIIILLPFFILIIILYLRAKRKKRTNHPPQPL